MRKIYFFVIISVYSFYSHANVVNENSANTLAVNFYKVTANPLSEVPYTASLNYTQTENDGTVDFYVFDISPAQGFVIVSATDNVTPVLAYSTESNFNSNFPDIGIKEWMRHTAGGIHQAILLNTPATNKTATMWNSYLQGQNPTSSRAGVVSPMLSTKWSQDPYYNVSCPYDNTNQGRCVTGCVATAMAQIMKFWSFPSQGVGSYSYVDSQGVDGYNWDIGRLSADFGATAYQWSAMPLNLDNGNPTVGQLMYQCGVAVGMNYSATGSEAYFDYPGHACALGAFTSYFSYDAQTIQYVVKAGYTSDAWQALIENELNNGRPVFYTGQDTANIGGHAWVCDGYDANGNLHMNWGWGGTDNGYYNTSDLDAAPYNFSWTQGAIIGIQPDPSVLALSVNSITPEQGFDLYPNPAKNKVTLIGNNTTNSEYTIYDAMGQRISAGSVSAESHSIDVSSLMTGVYFLSLQSGLQVSTHKFVVQQ